MTVAVTSDRVIAVPRAAPLIPEEAPFTPAQRAWLNGFFAGLWSASDATPPTAAPAAAGDPFGDGDDGAAPWHDQTLELDARMKLADGRPLRRRMMAAMAQQDCGQCGYDCENYANKIWLGEESRLNLCQPGGKATQRMLKTLFVEWQEAGKALAAPAVAAAAAAEPGYSRDAPVMARFLGAARLNRPGSEKETNHVAFRLDGTGLRYQPGDSIGVMPLNCPELVDAMIAALGGGAAAPPHERLLRDVCLKEAPDALFALLAELATDAQEKARLAAMAAGDDPDGDLETLDVLAVLEKFPRLRPDPAAFLAALEPLQPRLYSISSSQRVTPGEVHTTVAAVRYETAGRRRKGVASTFLADRLSPGAAVPVYIQKAHGFALPADDAVPIIMIGPGTGIAPFRAFLQERMARKAPGRAWLLFGDQRRATDFLYEDELQGFLATGTLTRLSTAFSRDQAYKVYVQDRMREEAADLWAWLEDGAYVYVCGDASRMAADVDRALVDVAASAGGLDAESGRAYVDRLGEAGRYQRDVY